MAELDHPAPIATAMGSDRLALWVRDRIEEILARMDSHMETEEWAQRQPNEPVTVA
ncbi:hypothetical protein ABZ894_14415 [Nocardia beijingensis]|uniref:hypothetical protein n=1 Tax=Nocardia beijingensis TaxID=95162 RepID=UPI0033E89943